MCDEELTGSIDQHVVELSPQPPLRIQPQVLFDLPQRLLTISHREVSADALEQALNSVGMKAQAVRDAAVVALRMDLCVCDSSARR